MASSRLLDGEINPVDVDPQLPQQVHQGAGTAAQIEHPFRLEHVLDQKGIFRLNRTAGLEAVVIAGIPPIAGEVLLVIMAGARPDAVR